MNDGPVRPDRSQLRLYNEFVRLWGTKSDNAHEVLDRLAERAQQDPVAYDLLLRAIQEQRLAYPAVRQILLTESAVEEAVQATLAIVALKLHLFEGKARFSTWLYRIASNEAKRIVRSQARIRKIDDVAWEPAYLHRLSSLVANRELVLSTMERIDEIYREPLRLREVDGLSYEEISSVLDIELGTVRSRLNRARRLVALELQGHLAS